MHSGKKPDDKSLLDLPNFKSNVHVYTLPKAAVEGMYLNGPPNNLSVVIYTIFVLSRISCTAGSDRIKMPNTYSVCSATIFSHDVT